MEKQLKIGIGLANSGRMFTTTSVDLICAIKRLPYEAYILDQRSCFVHDNRNRQALEAVKSGCTHLMFVDYDVHFSHECIEKLVDADKDVVGASYNYKKLPLESTIKFADENGNLVAKKGEDIPTTLFQCYALPTGLMLVKTEVFKKVEFPWFFMDYPYLNEKGEIENGWMEDVWFCRKVNQAGMTVWCDPTIGTRHIGDYEY
jgi:GT2 family glycosyltransferase